MKITTLFSLLLLCGNAFSQHPSAIFSNNNKTFFLGCGSSCTSIKVTVPHLKQSDDYLVSQIPYTPYSYATPAGNELGPLYSDDIYSSKITLPFNFCFFGTTYQKLVVGSNSIISFDTTNANCDNAFTVSRSLPFAGGTQCFQFSEYYPRASIFGPYHDIDPRLETPDRKIEWRMEGTAPNRRFIASFNEIPLFSCNSLSATHQTVIYESTGIVEVYLKSKPFCPAWNDGKAILGMQNFNRNKAVTPQGKNSTQWGSLNMNEGYRFLPSAGNSRFKRAEIIQNGNVVALADTASGNAGELNLTFNNICPTEDNTIYLLKVFYESCESASGEISFTDTVTVKKLFPAITATTQNALCTGGGSITVNAKDLQPPIQYSIDGNTFQSSNVFSGLNAGNYNVTVKDSTNCTLTTAATVALTNNLTLEPMRDTSVCKGTIFSPITTSNASTFSWSPGVGLDNFNIKNPLITANQTTTYTVTATLGSCVLAKAFTVNVLPTPTVSAGSSFTILEGDKVQLTASASEGTYLWTPSSGLSSASLLNPIASPLTTTLYKLTVTNSLGCTASDSTLITVLPFCVKPMEAFTPNGDGINDLWLITNGNCLKTAKVEVFNRYGTLVYRSNDYKNNWNGMYNNKPLPDGTYYYVIYYELINNTKVLKRGNVTILR